ncbi:MAG: transketolase, partial [Dehalococcoidia bacterium]|nr:transketolase [Dehalococcoidia bacterium]
MTQQPGEIKAPSLVEMQAIAMKLRRHIVTMIGRVGSGHPGGSLSAV